MLWRVHLISYRNRAIIEMLCLTDDKVVITRIGNNVITSTLIIDTNNEIDDRNSISLIFLIEHEENMKMMRNEIATMTEQMNRTIMTRCVGKNLHIICIDMQSTKALNYHDSLLCKIYPLKSFPFNDVDSSM